MSCRSFSKAALRLAASRRHHSSTSNRIMSFRYLSVDSQYSTTFVSASRSFTSQRRTSFRWMKTFLKGPKLRRASSVGCAHQFFQRERSLAMPFWLLIRAYRRRVNGLPAFLASSNWKPLHGSLSSSSTSVSHSSPGTCAAALARSSTAAPIVSRTITCSGSMPSMEDLSCLKLSATSRNFWSWRAYCSAAEGLTRGEPRPPRLAGASTVAFGKKSNGSSAIVRASSGVAQSVLLG